LCCAFIFTMVTMFTMGDNRRPHQILRGANR
jgi:hypothetical protein